VCKIFVQIISVRNHDTCALIKFLTSRRHFPIARLPVDQSHILAVFKLSKTAAHGGLSDAQNIRCTCDATVINNGNKQTKIFGLAQFSVLFL
jgi:hypothetical protein